jgi:hypothetical protein
MAEEQTVINDPSIASVTIYVKGQPSQPENK